MSKRGDLLKNTAILAIGKLVTQGIALALVPIYTFQLSADDYGIFDLMLTYAAMLAPALTLQVEMASFRFLVDARGDDKAIKSVVSSIFSILASALGIAVVAGYIIGATFNIPFIVTILAVIVMSALASVLLQFSRGLGQNGVFAVGSIISALTTLVLVISLVMLDGVGVQELLVVTIVSSLLTSGFVVYKTRLWRYVAIKSVSRELRERILSYSVPLVPNSVGLWLIGASDRTVIAIVVDIASSGVYAVASRFSGALLGLFGVYNMSWTESVSLHINSKDRDQFLSESFNTGVKSMIAISTFAVAVMHFAFPLMVSAQFHDAYLYIPVLMLASVFGSAMAMFGAVYIAKKMTKSVAYTTISAALLNIVLTVSFTYAWGVWGAVVATLLSYIAIVTIRHFDIRKYVSIRYDMSMFIFMLLGYGTVSVLYYANTVAAGVVGLLVATVVCFVALRTELLLLVKKLKVRLLRGPR